MNVMFLVSHCVLVLSLIRFQFQKICYNKRRKGNHLFWESVLRIEDAEKAIEPRLIYIDFLWWWIIDCWSLISTLLCRIVVYGLQHVLFYSRSHCKYFIPPQTKTVNHSFYHFPEKGTMPLYDYVGSECVHCFLDNMFVLKQCLSNNSCLCL